MGRRLTAGILTLALVAALLVSSPTTAGIPLLTTVPSAPGQSAVASPPPISPVHDNSSIVPSSADSPSLSSPPTSLLEARVIATTHALGAAGVPIDQIRLPSVGTPDTGGTGPLAPGSTLPSPVITYPPGVAYYGESVLNGSVHRIVLNATGVVGTLRVNQLDTLYLDTDNPDMSGVQLNSVLTRVTLWGTGDYTFWAQNAVDYSARNQTVSFGDNLWNFSSTAYTVPAGNSTIQAHSPNGSIEGGIYLGMGPSFRAPMPFTLALYLNSTLTPAGDQEVWFNYSLAASGEPNRNGSYDWVVFHSRSPAQLKRVPLAAWQANGLRRSSTGFPEDFELDFGIGGYNGANMDVLAANLSASLWYCPYSSGTCATGGLRTVPAATNFGSETGETGAGLAITYSGTTAVATAGPALPSGLWGYGNRSEAFPGSTRVANGVSVAGSPIRSSTVPYVFIFLENEAKLSAGYAWAPDAPFWDLMPGNYSYEVMLSNYAEQTGTLTVGSHATALTVTLPYSPPSGFYTPLWSFSNAQLSGISTEGNGSLADPYELFNHPTSNCTQCGGAPNGGLAPAFFSFNGYYYPTFFGILLADSDAYVVMDHAPSLLVHTEEYGIIGAGETYNFYLQIGFYSADDVTLEQDGGVRGWGLMTEIFLRQYAPAAQDPFPLSDVSVWFSSHDLFLSDRFIAVTPLITSGLCTGLCPIYSCPVNLCASPDQLLLYGGSNNTVWGNTMEDPPGYAFGSVFAGLAEAESGDLVYNNNFSIDNPVMLMVYDIYRDSCPISYAGTCSPLVLPSYQDTWNVSNQSATSVAHVVNGFALSGNVLGLGYHLQGGNYWWNWGDSLNPFSRIPYTNRYNYTEYQSIFPGGYGQNVDSITNGGDYVPLRIGYAENATSTFSVDFHESGLSPGTEWSVTLGGVQRTSSSGAMVFIEPNGTYSYTVGSIPGYTASPSSGTVTVNGTAVNAPTLVFTQATYEVTFTEAGLLPGTSWSVTVNGTTRSTVSSAIAFAESDGIYPLYLWDVRGYMSHANVTAIHVNGASVDLTVYYLPPAAGTYYVTFFQTGLPLNAYWTVELSDGYGQNTYGPTHTPAAGNNGPFNGTITWRAFPSNITAFPDDMYYPFPSTGQVVVNGSSVLIHLTFRFSYPFVFIVNGLPTSASFSLQVLNETFTSSGGVNVNLILEVPNGTYSWNATSAGYQAQNGTISVLDGNGSNVEEIHFQALAQTFTIPTWAWIGIGIAVVVVFIGLAVFLLRRRTGRR